MTVLQKMIDGAGRNMVMYCSALAEQIYSYSTVLSRIVIQISS